MGMVIGGVDCDAYSCADGIGGTPTWVALDIIGDVKIQLQHTEASYKDRSSGWVKYGAAFKDASVTFRLSRKTGNTQYEMLRDAWKNKSVIGLAFMSGPVATVGSEGLQADCQVFGFDVSEGDEEFSMVDVTVKPAGASANEPTFVEVSA